jgi:thiamine-monophosphate kinase
MNKKNLFTEESVIDLFSSEHIHPLVNLGIGDDAAILEKDHNSYYVFTTDLLTEEVHFRRSTITPWQLGYKSLAVNLSDVAAMGAEPTAAFLSISFPGDTDFAWVEEFSSGIKACGEKYSCHIIGGDTTSSKESIFVSISVIGHVKKKEVLLRDTASSGDEIWISGLPGISAAALKHLEGEIEIPQELMKSFSKAHLQPEPDIELGRILAKKSLATSCMDCSDGLIRDLTRLTQASGTGAIIEESSLPIGRLSFLDRTTAIELALHGGEDYYLLFTTHPNSHSVLADFDGLYQIGLITPEPGVSLLKQDGSLQKIQAQGFEHFA